MMVVAYVGRDSMYWWNVSKLAEDLREGRVEEKERFKYYFAYSPIDSAQHVLENVLSRVNRR
jgi:hypothetical protein